MGIGREGNVESHSRTPLVHGCRLSVTHAISKLKESFGGILFQAKYSQLRQPIFADKPTFLEQACSTETGMFKGTPGGGKCITDISEVGSKINKLGAKFSWCLGKNALKLN